jgi:acyl-coenzyme A thioesterase PaaI-like protein
MEKSLGLSFEELTNFLSTMLPKDYLVIESLTESAIEVCMSEEFAKSRLGDTISGPTQMELADATIYALVISKIGYAGANAVTANLSINFLNKPSKGALRAKGNLLKLGGRTLTGNVLLYDSSNPEPVAHAVVSYALPLINRESKYPESIHLKTHILEKYAGTYQSNASGDSTVMTYAVKDGHFLLVGENNDSSELLAESHTRFYSTTLDLQIEFQIDSNGEILGSKNKFFGSDFQFRKR